MLYRFFYTLFFVCLPVSVVFGADLLADISVLERQAGGFQPKGFKLSRFDVFPKIETETHYTSNLFQTQNNQKSDRYLILKPSIVATTDFSDHKMTVSVQGQKNLYDEYSNQNYTDIHFATSLDLRLSRSASVDLNIFHKQDHEQRFVFTGSQALDKPISISSHGFITTMKLQPARWRWEASLSAAQYAYDDAKILGTDTPIIQRDRDHTGYQAGLKVTYDSGKRWTPYLGIRYARAIYDRRDFVDGSGFNGVVQDKDQYDIYAGIDLLASQKLRGRAQLGYGFENNDDNAIDNQDTGLIDIDLTYLYSPITNIVMSAKRFFSDDSISAQGIIETQLSGMVIHELTRQWVLRGGANWTHRDFQSNTESDDTLQFLLGAEYQINRNVAVSGEISHQDRDSNRVGSDFSDTRALVRLKTQF